MRDGLDVLSLCWNSVCKVKSCAPCTDRLCRTVPLSLGTFRNRSTEFLGSVNTPQCLVQQGKPSSLDCASFHVCCVRHPLPFRAWEGQGSFHQQLSLRATVEASSDTVLGPGNHLHRVRVVSTVLVSWVVPLLRLVVSDGVFDPPVHQTGSPAFSGGTRPCRSPKIDLDVGRPRPMVP